MTEPSPARPLPGAPTRGEDPPDGGGRAEHGAPAAGHVPRPYADLEQRPVDQHVEVFEAEHARLQDELSTIDRL